MRTCALTSWRIGCTWAHRPWYALPPNCRSTRPRWWKSKSRTPSPPWVRIIAAISGCESRKLGISTWGFYAAAAGAGFRPATRPSSQPATISATRIQAWAKVRVERSQRQKPRPTIAIPVPAGIRKPGASIPARRRKMGTVVQTIA